jgi:hypothetical protein
MWLRWFFWGCLMESYLHGLYPNLPWDPQHGWDGCIPSRRQGLASIAEANFGLAGFVSSADLPLCEQLGLGAILYHPVPDPNKIKWSDLPEHEIDNMIRGWVDEDGPSPAIYGYYIKDEPGANDFAGLARAVAAVARHAPGKIAYINLFPNYATLGAHDLSQLQTGTFEEYLDRFCKEVHPPFISYDNYQVQFSMDLNDAAHASSYFTNLVQVRAAALKYNLPWRQIVSSNQIRPHTTIPSPANLMLQAYTSLAGGASCVDWYTYYERGYAYAPVDSQDERSQTWYYLAEVNRQLKLVGPQINKLRSFGVYLYHYDMPGYAALPYDMQGYIDATEPLMVGSFGGSDGLRYGMLVNLSLSHSAKITITVPMAEGRLEQFSTASGRYIPCSTTQPIWLVAGQGILLRAQW